MKQVGIIMGSDSDLPIMQDAAKMLEQFGVEYEITVISAHRTPEEVARYAKSAGENGIKIIIAGAGGSAHLPGMIAAETALPVIGVPIKTKIMEGLDSLLSIFQMPPGIPVATVSVNGAKNAGILAAEMLGMTDNDIHAKIVDFKKKLNEEVKAKGKELLEIGYEKYLAKMNEGK